MKKLLIIPVLLLMLGNISAQQVTLNKSSYEIGESITVNFSSSTSSKDWVALFTESTVPGNQNNLGWLYTSNSKTSSATTIASGSVTFNAGVAIAGKFKACLLADDGYTVAASVNFDVVNSSGSTTVRVVCIGNSITEGVGVSNPAVESYPAQLGKLLGSKYSVLNCGVSGRTLLKKGDYPYWNEAKFTAAKNYDPQIVTIALGTNDSKDFNWLKFKGEFYSDYVALINEFRKNGKNPQIFVCLPPPAYLDNYHITDSVIRDEIIPLIDSVCTTMGTSRIDFFHPLLPCGDYFTDAIHPNLQGATAMAKMVYDAITKSVDITSVYTPTSAYSRTNHEKIGITINNNYKNPLKNVPVAYRLDNGAMVKETIDSIPACSEIKYSFKQLADLSAFKEYNLQVLTAIDSLQNNDTLQVKLTNFKSDSDLALFFPGDNGKVKVSNSSKFQPKKAFTAEAWVYPTAFRNAISKGTVMSNEQALPGRGFYISIGNGGQVRFSMFDATQKSVAAPKGTIVLNKWQHIAGVYDGSTIKLYVDGTLKSTLNTGAAKVSDGNLYLGQTALASMDRAFIGSIDEVRLWNVALTEAQINERKGHQLWGNESGLAAYYNFNDGLGSKTANNLTGGKTGVLSNIATNEAWIAGAGTTENTGTAQKDVAVFDILSPKSQKGLTNLESVKVKVFNYNDIEQLNVPVSYVVDNNAAVSETIARIAPQSSFEHTFSKKADLSDFKSYTIKAYTSLVGDNVTYNDSISINLKNIDPATNYALVVTGAGSGMASIPHAESLMPITAFTVQAWVYPTTFRANIWQGSVVSKESSNGGFALDLGGSGQGRLVIGGSTWFDAVVPAGTFTLKKWAQFTGVYDGSNMYVYVDGVLKATKTGVGAITPSTSDMNIGTSSYFTEREFQGGIDEVSLWNRALTDKEILEKKNFPLTGKEEGLVAYYKLNEGPGYTTVVDSTGKGNNGTIQNMSVINCWMPGVDVYSGGTVAVSQTPLKPTILVYPNPTEDFIKVRLGNNETMTQLFMTDMLGRTVFTSNLKDSGSEFIVDVRTFTKGLYLLTLKGSSEPFVTKIVVK